MIRVCERTFRRFIDRYEDEGLEGLIKKQLNQVSHRLAPVDEVIRLVDRYRSRHEGWNAKHFYAWYKCDGGGRSYIRVKNRLQEAKLVPKAVKRGAHLKPSGTQARYRVCCCIKMAPHMNGYRSLVIYE